MKRQLIIGISVLALVLPGILMAQGDITLEDLAAQVEGLTSRVSDLFTTQDDLAQRLAAVETAIAPTPTATPSPTVTPVPLDEARRLSRLLVLNDYNAAGHEFLDLNQDEKDRLKSVYYEYFVAASEVCGLTYGDAFWLFQKYANMVDRRGLVARLGKFRDIVPGGGFRFDFIHRIATNSVIQAAIETSSCADYLAWYTR